MCRYCQDGGEETFIHILTDCDFFANARFQIFGYYELNDGNFIVSKDLKIAKLVNFLKEVKLDAFQDLIEIDEPPDP